MTFRRYYPKRMKINEFVSRAHRFRNKRGKYPIVRSYQSTENRNCYELFISLTGGVVIYAYGDTRDNLVERIEIREINLKENDNLNPSDKEQKEELTNFEDFMGLEIV